MGGLFFAFMAYLVDQTYNSNNEDSKLYQFIPRHEHRHHPLVSSRGTAHGAYSISDYLILSIFPVLQIGFIHIPSRKQKGNPMQIPLTSERYSTPMAPRRSRKLNIQVHYILTVMGGL